MTELERYLAAQYHKPYCVFTGSGTSALYLAFCLVGMQEKKVLYPAISCVNPVNAAIYAGYDVDFCDISIDSFTINLELLDKKLSTGCYGILVPTHIYGHKENMSVIQDICSKYGVRIIEDCAQAVKVYGNDLAIVSFGHTKVFESKLGGGAVFCEDEESYSKLIKLKKSLHYKNSNYNEVVTDYRKKYYDIINGEEDRNTKLGKIGQLQKKMLDMDIFDADDNMDIITIIENKDKIINDRICKKKLYDKLLIGDGIIRPVISSDEVLWRYSFLYTKDRAQLLKMARNKGIDISTWYPSLSVIYKGYDCENAKTLEKRVVNLWVDSSHSEEQIKSEIHILNQIMEDDCNGME